MNFANGLGLRLLQETGGGIADTIKEIVGYATLAIEFLAVVIIVVFTVGATYSFARRLSLRQSAALAFDEYKVRLGRGLLVGLEILVAADIVRTVVLELSFENVAILGLLVLIRTFLSWSLVLEIEHRWPWQSRGAAHEAGGEANDAPQANHA